MVIYCPCRECWGNFSIRCSLARSPTQGHLSLHFAFCIFSNGQTYFGGERSNMLVLHLPTNRPWRRSWETKVRTEGLWWLLQSREKDVTEHQILLSVMWGCNRLNFLFFEKIRGPTAASRGEILATPGRGDPVVHSLTGSSRLSFALSLWPQRLFCTAVLLFYCSPTVLLFYCTAPCPTFLQHRPIVGCSDLRLCGSSGCSLPSWTRSGPDTSLTSFFLFGESTWKKWLRVVLIFLSFRTPTARRWRSGRRTTPSSRMSTTCATPRWPSGWRMLRR